MHIIDEIIRDRRREKAHIPKEIKFKTKPQIALDQLRAACAAGIPRGVALTDGSYGSNLSFRTGMRQLALDYMAAIVSTLKVRAVPTRRAAQQPEETLLIGWPKGVAKPTKYWPSTPDDSMSFEHPVDISKMRWRIERDYRDLKQEVGLGHYGTVLLAKRNPPIHEG